MVVFLEAGSVVIFVVMEVFLVVFLVMKVR